MLSVTKQARWMGKSPPDGAGHQTAMARLFCDGTYMVGGAETPRATAKLMWTYEWADPHDRLTGLVG